MTTRTHAPRQRRRAFTIIELIVVIGVIGVLALLTTIGARRLTSGSRLAAGTNAVTNALGTARAAAIRSASPMAVVFRPVWEATKPHLPQRVEMVTVRSTKERSSFGSNAAGPRLAERWIVADDVPAILLPEGIKVAGPMFDPPGAFGAIPSESVYATQAELPALANCSESIECNRVVAVLFGSSGEFLTRPPSGGLSEMKAWVDWNRSTPDPANPQEVAAGDCGDGGLFDRYWLQDHVNDECNLMFVPFLSVYDDRAARELKSLDWSNTDNLISELTGPTGYIAQYGDRISFNRFSGLPERKAR